ncbi:MAG: hypothetical protein Q8S19_07405 [Bacillota bacterium]|nr:hypothetical protein [Bacillota bacterium]
MLFTLIEFMKTYWVQMFLGLGSLAGAKALSDELVLKHPKGGASKLARFVLGFYFAMFFYGASYYVVTLIRQVSAK